jgi:ABC-type uncharacterized transport system substrate-binding protein
LEHWIVQLGILNGHIPDWIMKFPHHSLVRPGISIVLLALFVALAPGSAVLAGPSGPTADSAQDMPQTEPVRVLWLHSYHPEFSWEQELSAGIEAGFAAGGFSAEAGNLEMDHFWMDTKRHVDEAYFARIAAEAQAYIRQQQPDVVIATDNNAIRLVVASWPDDDLPFVFAGLNNSPEDIPGLAGRSNVTGVLERAHIGDVVEWVAFVLPDGTRIAFVADASVTTEAYLADVEATLAATDYLSDYQLFTTNVYPDFQAFVTAAPERFDLLIMGTYQTLVDAAGETVPSGEVMAWAVAYSDIPIVPLWEVGVREGALGGPVISGETQGYAAAQTAVRILAGEPPGNIAITVPRRGKLTLNVAAVDRWNIAVPDSLWAVSILYGPDGEVVSQR